MNTLTAAQATPIPAPNAHARTAAGPPSRSLHTPSRSPAWTPPVSANPLPAPRQAGPRRSAGPSLASVQPRAQRDREVTSRRGSGGGSGNLRGRGEEDRFFARSLDVLTNHMHVIVCIHLRKAVRGENGCPFGAGDQSTSVGGVYVDFKHARGEGKFSFRDGREEAIQ